MQPPRVKSMIKDFSKTPDQVLKFIVYEQAKENYLLKQELQLVKRKLDMDEKYPEDDGLMSCSLCYCWEGDVFNGTYCVMCDNVYCFSCMTNKEFVEADKINSDAICQNCIANN